jgi:cytochrome c biogenesis protein CcmG, thiol:disulfide interchange protein DsbE
MKRMIVPALASICGAALLGLLLYGVTHQAASRSLDEAIALGHPRAAPEARVSLPALSGGHGATLASYAGKVVLLNFWASWCAPCEQEAPLLEQAQRSLERHGATVIGVTYKDVTSDSLGFVHRYHLTYPTLRDATGSFAQAYGTDQLPESFVIDRSGKVVSISRGEVDEQFLQKAIRLAEST